MDLNVKFQLSLEETWNFFFNRFPHQDLGLIFLLLRVQRSNIGQEEVKEGRRSCRTSKAKSNPGDIAWDWAKGQDLGLVISCCCRVISVKSSSTRRLIDLDQRTRGWTDVELPFLRIEPVLSRLHSRQFDGNYLTMFRSFDYVHYRKT